MVFLPRIIGSMLVLASIAAAMQDDSSKYGDSASNDNSNYDGCVIPGAPIYFKVLIIPLLSVATKVQTRGMQVHRHRKMTLITTMGAQLSLMCD